MIFKVIPIVAMIFTSTITMADVTLTGAVPSFQISGLQTKIDKIWRHETALYSNGGSAATLAPPEIYFSRFTLKDESSEWAAWQKTWIAGNQQIWRDWVSFSGMPSAEITQDWINAHIDTIFPFPATFLAFHYDTTNKIQINPDATFLRYYQNNPHGIKEDTVGYGFYVASHEMMHYLLENRGIPSRIHHCLFISAKANGTSLMSDVADYLIGEGISASLIKSVGVQGEMSLMPCEALTDAEREQVRQVLSAGELDQ